MQKIWMCNSGRWLEHDLKGIEVEMEEVPFSASVGSSVTGSEVPTVVGSSGSGSDHPTGADHKHLIQELEIQPTKFYEILGMYSSMILDPIPQRICIRN